MGRPKGSKNKPKTTGLFPPPKPTNTNLKQPIVPKHNKPLTNPNWKAPEDFTVTAIPKEVWDELKPGRRVKTNSSCVVGGLVFVGTIISRDPNSEFLRINWDVKGSQAAHWKTISVVGSALEGLPKPEPTTKPASTFILPAQLPEQAPKRRGRPPGSKNKVKHK